MKQSNKITKFSILLIEKITSLGIESNVPKLLTYTPHISDIRFLNTISRIFFKNLIIFLF